MNFYSPSLVYRCFSFSQGHLRVARASKMKTKNKRAAHAYINCFNYSIQETKDVQKDILKELVEVSLLLSESLKK